MDQLDQLHSTQRLTIIADFGEVLETNAPHTYGVSERFLPHPRERIEEALREQLLVEEDPTRIDALEVAYLELAKFLPDPDGSIAMAITRTLFPTPTDLEGVRQYANDPEVSAALEHAGRLSQILAERTAPAMEEIKQLRQDRKVRTGDPSLATLKPEAPTPYQPLDRIARVATRVSDALEACERFTAWCFRHRPQLAFLAAGLVLTLTGEPFTGAHFSNAWELLGTWFLMCFALLIFEFFVLILVCAFAWPNFWPMGPNLGRERSSSEIDMDVEIVVISISFTVMVVSFLLSGFLRGRIT